jgi:flagellar biosynthesis/type III secretory pathway M-ring protein FliF/YscJ
MKRLILFENKNLLSGQQEYSQRQAGIASGIVLAVLVPLVLLLVYIAYKFFERKQKEKDEEEEEAMNFEAQKRYGKISIVNKNMFQNYTMDIN